jgi:hypothetical protein
MLFGMQKKTLGILFVTLLIDMIGIGMIIPIIPIIFTDPTSPSFLLSGYSQQEQYFFCRSLDCFLWFDAIFQRSAPWRTFGCVWKKEASHPWCGNFSFFTTVIWIQY